MSNEESLLDRLKAASVGEAVWRVMTPDGKAYVLEFSFSDSAMPASEATNWLKEQNSKGNYAGYYVDRATRYDSRDRLIHEAIFEITRLRKLEQGYQELIEMRTRD